MDDSTQLAIEVLRSTDDTRRFDQLAQAFNLGLHCFHEWGLISDNKQTYLENLCVLGAVALKPTGAGNGGYVLSLWRDVPSKTLLEEMIPVEIV